MTPPPSIVGRYHVVRLIAHGGMGSLYLARDPAIERLVAIKLLKDGFDDSQTRERFAREARAAGRLHHPNIVTVFDVGEHEGRPFIAMEYVAGDTLAQLISRRAVRRLSEKLAILEVLCAALHYAHNAGIVHRDIKPANVMLDAAGVLKVLDFGIARAGGLLATRVGDVVGTLNYMSPEQLAGGEVDHRTDIYSVGALAYELITNQMSFPGTITTGVLHKILSAPPPAIAAVVPGIDADIPAIVEHAMEKDPDARYQDLDAMRADLAQVRSRLLESGSDLDDDPDTDADAETRFYAPIGSSSPLKSPQPSAWALPSSAQHRAPRPAARAWPSRRIGLAVLLAAGAVVLAAALAAWFNAPARDDATPPITGPAAQDMTPANPAATAPPPTVSDQPPPAPDRPVSGGRGTDADALRAIRTTAREQIAAGNRPAALATLAQGLALNAADVELNSLIDELVAAARRAAVEARTAALRRGETSSSVFRDGRSQERNAESQLRGGDRIPAIQSFWAAASRYNQVPEVVAPRASTPSRQASLPPAVPPASTAPIEVTPPESKKTESAPVRPPAAAKSPPAPTNPAATPKPDAEAPLPEREPAPDPAEVARQGVREALRRYTQAYQALDSAAVGAVMPTLTPEQLRNLDRDFSNYRTYVVDIRDERISVDGDAATVAGEVVRSFETRNGVSGSNTVATVFHLRRAGAAWVIERLEVR